MSIAIIDNRVGGVKPVNPNLTVSSNYWFFFNPKNDAVAQATLPCNGYSKLYLYGDSYQHNQSNHTANAGYIYYHWIYADGSISADATLLTILPTVCRWTEITIPTNAIGISFNCTKTSTGATIYYAIK